MGLFNLFQNSTTSNNSQPTTRPAGPGPQAEEGLSSTLALGAGCYWGTEKYVRQNFQAKFPGSIQKTQVGFMSPSLDNDDKNPTYEQVCRGLGTGQFVEVLWVELNEPEKHYEELIRFFFQFHDPTTNNRQGNDVGFQYSSTIFCSDERQFQIANKVRNELQAVLDAGGLSRVGGGAALGVAGSSCYEGQKVSTSIVASPIRKFTPAHDAHQLYLEKNPNGYCNHRMRFKMWPELVTPTEADTN